MSETQVTAEHLKFVAAQKAAEDDAFRAELLSNPRAAIEKLFNVELPAQITLKAIEEPADTYTVVVPAKVAAGKDGELSDSDLEAVAGGSKSGAKTFFTGVGSALGVVAGAPVSQSHNAVKACF
jgi:hypothetical protein